MDRRLLLVLAVGVLAVALVLGGLTLVDRVRGGASSPTVLADEITTALDSSDLGAVVRLVEPGERAALRRVTEAWSHRLANLDLPDAVGGGRSEGRPLDGLDLTFTQATPRVESQSGDVAVVGLPNLTLRIRSTPAAAHGLLRALFTYGRITEPQDETYPATALPYDLPPRFVAVERSGRWYLSLFATLLGPGVAQSSTPDVRALEPTWSPTPQAAVETTIRALVGAFDHGDVGAFARTLDASSSDAVQLWASQVSLGAASRPGAVETIRTSAVSADASRVAVRVDTLHVSGGSTLDFADGCATVRQVRACLHRSGYRYADGIPELSSFALLGHDGGFWLTAVQGGGGWRTSLPDSLADALVAYADRFTREQALAVLHRPTLDDVSGELRADVPVDVTFTSAGYALRTLHVAQTGLYRVVPSPAGLNRAAVYDADGQPAIQPFYPNDSVYQLEPGDHRVLVWADDAFSATLDRTDAPYMQRVEIRTVR
ncbi:hypothetical protein [uncultured Amnibacterium sp.]|uniref:hypothetical protein n=1 Tax=uncultured Amnibacterium sp. TaxID=1631851 RepID=UPI0035CAA941